MTKDDLTRFLLIRRNGVFFWRVEAVCELCHDCRVLIGRVLRGARRGALIVEALGNIISLCQQLEKNEDIRSAVHKRLVFVSEELGKTSDEEAMR
ncbi:hypothetical protein PR001_g26805 [Phytophthora rubi]|uniref:Uncharacterized protein n=1 Tax=Phytophthora rubi TaxID=129364 RepID=A0A6A3HQR1_9STRA|nr:hypothetical protein PR001_g26805 [Phytophthora rubi]